MQLITLFKWLKTSVTVLSEMKKKEFISFPKDFSIIFHSLGRKTSRNIDNMLTGENKKNPFIKKFISLISCKLLVKENDGYKDFYKDFWLRTLHFFLLLQAQFVIRKSLLIKKFQEVWFMSSLFKWRVEPIPEGSGPRSHNTNAE